MTLEIHEEPIADLKDHAKVPIAYTVSARMRVEGCDVADGGRLVEEPVDPPYEKDYDAEAGGGPDAWPVRFDVSRWGLLVARLDGRRVGGAVVAWNTEGVSLLEGRDDLALLWDLRVDPALRRRGIGAALFDRAVLWAQGRGCVQLDVETQDVNVPACRFYASRGCALRRIDPDAYPELPHETMLLWSLAP